MMRGDKHTLIKRGLIIIHHDTEYHMYIQTFLSNHSLKQPLKQLQYLNLPS